MIKHNPNNERIKRRYFIFLKEAKRQNEQSIDAVAKAINRFEVYTKFRDFKSFRSEQAIGFKKYLANQESLVTGDKLSKATLHSTLRHLKGCFQWIALQPGYKSRIDYTDSEYFNLSEKDTRAATARVQKPAPTLEQINHVLSQMPFVTDVQKRNRALIAFTLLTGARDRAISSLKLKHVDISTGSIFQDGREVQTKFSKTFTTYFFPVGEEVRKIVIDWVIYLRETLLFGNDDPLFPKTRVVVGEARTFEASGLTKEHWSTASPIRGIFKEAFESAGLPYFNPHSFRNTLVRLGEKVCETPELLKAWSQNLGHESVLTTLYSYGEVQTHRQAEIFEQLREPPKSKNSDVGELAKAILKEMKSQNLTKA